MAAGCSIPLLYWQFNSAASTVERIDGYLKPAIAGYFPDVVDHLYEGSFYLNSNMRRYEFYDELTARGVTSEMESSEPPPQAPSAPTIVKAISAASIRFKVLILVKNSLPNYIAPKTIRVTNLALVL